MKKALFFLLMLLVLLIGCVPLEPTVKIVTATPVITEEDPTPTAEGPDTVTWGCDDVPSADDGFRVLNDNPCMNDPIHIPYQPEPWGTITERYRPSGTQFFAKLKTIDGLTGAAYFTAMAPVLYEEEINAYVFDISAKAGEWGYGEGVVVNEPTCLFIKATGTFSIHDPLYRERYYHYGLHTYIQRQNGAEIDLHRIELAAYTNNGEFGTNMHWVVDIETPGYFNILVYVFSSYASSLPGSWVAWETFSIAEAPSGYCDGENVFSAG